MDKARSGVRDSSHDRVRTLLLLSLMAATLAPARVLAGVPDAWFAKALGHPAVAAAAGRVEAATAAEDAARWAWAGSGQAFVEELHSNDQRFVGMMTPQAFANPTFSDDLTTYGVRYSLPIDLWGVIAATRRAADADRRMAELALRQQQLMRLHQVTAAYATLLVIREQQATLKTQAERTEQTLVRVQRQIDNGDAATADLRLAQAEQARVQAGSEQLAAQQASAMAALDDAIGAGSDADGTTRIAADATLPTVPAWPQLDADSALAVSLADATAQSARAQADQARRSLYPSLSASGDYQRFDDGSALPEAWSVGARISIPIDPAGWKRAGSARVRADAAVDDVAAARRELQRQWTDLQGRYKAALAELSAVESERAALAEVVQVRTELHRVGMISAEDLLRQQRDLLQAESSQAQLRAQALIAWSSAAVLSGMEPQVYREIMSGP